MRVMPFEWDELKASGNSSKHGVTFAEAVTVFGDFMSTVTFDPDHSDDEERQVIIGYSSAGNLLFVSFTERRDAIRIISARKATRSERTTYEESI